MKITVEEIRSNKVLALSWKEPYGSLMLHGKIETRTWKTNYRGLVLICLSQQPYKSGVIEQISGKYQRRRLIELLNTNEAMSVYWGKSGFVDFYGKAFSIGRLVDCRPMKTEDENKTFVKYYPDLFCHVYEDVTPIVPFQWKGKQGWSTVSDEVKNKIILKN